ncbi:MAG TPA: flagellar hook-length control protein FliK [Vicinamibacterales bacterium]
MSIAINPMPAASSLDDAAAPSAVTPDGNSFLPFASILDEQFSANQDADDVGVADAPLDVFDAAVPASQPPVDSLGALLTGSLAGARALLHKDEIDQSTTTQGQQGTSPRTSQSGVKDANDVGEADAPLDIFETAIPASQPPVDSLGALLAASLPGTRPLLAKDEIDQSTTTQGQRGASPRTSTSGVKEADDVGEAGPSLDVLDAAIPVSPSPVGSLTALLTAYLPGARPLPRKDEIDQSTTPQGSVKKDKVAVDATVLLLQAAQSPESQLDMSSASSPPAPSPSGVKDADDVGETDAPLAVLDATIPTSQPPIDSLAALLTASLPGTRPLLRKDEIDQSTTTQGSIKKDRPAVDPTALLLLAAQSVVRQLDTSPAPSAPAPSRSDVKNPVTTDEPIRRMNNDELVPHLFTALTETDARAVLNADSDDAPLPAAAAPLTDLLIKASEQNAEAEPLRVPDLPLPRTPTTTAPAGASMVDAIRLAISQGPQFDQDRGFAQSSTAGLDRRASKTAVVPAIHLTEAGSVDAAVRPSAPSSVPAVTLPNEDGVMSSIVQSMRLQMRDGVGTAVVHLAPDYLGAVSISLRVENGVVTASLHAENPQVRAWMEANAPLLRESLAGQGLSLDRLLVTDEHIVDDQSQGRRQRQDQEQRAQPRPRRNGAATFEVVV